MLIVDEMCDTGNTMACLVKMLEDRDAASVKSCVLLNKGARRTAPVQPDYIGAECPDEFVVGYGMDYQERSAANRRPQPTNHRPASVPPLHPSNWRAIYLCATQPLHPRCRSSAGTGRFRSLAS